MITAKETLDKLEEVNKRFESGNSLLVFLAKTNRRIKLQSGQEPYAIL